MSATAKGRLRTHLPFILKASVSIGLIGYLLFIQIDNVDAIWLAMSQADPVLLMLAFSLNTIGYLLCSWRWQLLLRAQRFVVPLIELIRAYTIGIFFNSFLPGVMSGDVMRAMDISDRVPSYTRSFLILFVERLTGMFGLLLLAVIALPSIGWVAVSRTGIGWLLLAAAAVLVLLTAIFLSRHVRAGAMRLGRLRGLTRLRGIMDKVSETSAVFSERMHVVYGCVGISFFFQANVVCHYWLIGLALGIDLPLMAYFAIVPASLFLMMIPASVNGIGIREQAFIYLFGQFGVAAEFAISLAWIAFAMVMAQAVVGGILFALRRKRPHPAAARL